MMKKTCPTCGEGYFLNPITSEINANFEGWCSNCCLTYLLPLEIDE